MPTDFLTANEKTLFTNDFKDLIGDASIGISVTYRPFSSKGTFSPSTGKVVETYAADQTINSFRAPLSEREIETSGGKYQAGDWRYLIRVADVATPKKDDRIIDSTIVRYVIGFSSDPLRIMHSIVVRNLG